MLAQRSAVLTWTVQGRCVAVLVERRGARFTLLASHQETVKDADIAATLLRLYQKLGAKESDFIILAPADPQFAATIDLKFPKLPKKQLVTAIQEAASSHFPLVLDKLKLDLRIISRAAQYEIRIAAIPQSKWDYCSAVIKEFGKIDFFIIHALVRDFPDAIATDPDLIPALQVAQYSLSDGAQYDRSILPMLPNEWRRNRSLKGKIAAITNGVIFAAICILFIINYLSSLRSYDKITSDELKSLQVKISQSPIHLDEILAAQNEFKSSCNKIQLSFVIAELSRLIPSNYSILEFNLNNQLLLCRLQLNSGSDSTEEIYSALVGSNIFEDDISISPFQGGLQITLKLRQNEL